MAEVSHIQQFYTAFEKSLAKEDFSGIKLAQRRSEDIELKTVTIKLVLLKKGPHLSFVYRYPTKDITKNFPVHESHAELKHLVEGSFLQAELNTVDFNYYLTMFPTGRSKFRHKRNDNKIHISKSHDHEKNRMIKSENNLYLRSLGVTNQEFRVKDKMQDKYKQINKYVEIIDDILKKTKIGAEAKIVDMGSGKGYLTFALYDYFLNTRKEVPSIYGIEIREDLVKKCNQIAEECGYDKLSFIDESIERSEVDQIDFLLALHACDTATDDAIYKGIKSKAKLIVCAPCCHKQVRKQMGVEGVTSNITKHGSLKERQAEILTDTIRAMILEAHGYKTRVFEFISTVHTPKNLLIVASLEDALASPNPEIIQEIQDLKSLFHVGFHHLEKLTGIVL